MKITSQSADTLVLTESGTSGMVMGVVFVVAGLAVGFFLRSSHPMAIWAALWVVVIGLVVICISSSITVEADRASGQLCYQKKVLIGGQDSTYAIADVLRIEIRKEWHINTDARGQWRINADAGGRNVSVRIPDVEQWQSMIVFKDGRELALGNQRSSSRSMVLIGCQGADVAIASRMAEFLGVPFQETATPDFGIGINKGGGPGIQL